MHGDTIRLQLRGISEIIVITGTNVSQNSDFIIRAKSVLQPAHCVLTISVCAIENVVPLLEGYGEASAAFEN